MTSMRLSRSSVSTAGKLKDAEATAIGAGMVRLDLLASVPPDHASDDRYCAVIDLHTARAFAVMLIDAIAKAELEEARNKPKRKKK